MLFKIKKSSKHGSFSLWYVKKQDGGFDELISHML